MAKSCEAHLNVLVESFDKVRKNIMIGEKGRDSGSVKGADEKIDKERSSEVVATE
jgi:hypothetical protein